MQMKRYSSPEDFWTLHRELPRSLQLLPSGSVISGSAGTQLNLPWHESSEDRDLQLKAET